MSYVIATPEMMATAAFDLARIGSQVSAASAVAAMPTTEVVAAGADEVSAGIAALFSAHAQEYQALSAQAAAFHDQFVHTLTAAARWYTAVIEGRQVGQQDAVAHRVSGLHVQVDM